MQTDERRERAIEAAVRAMAECKPGRDWSTMMSHGRDWWRDHARAYEAAMKDAGYVMVRPTEIAITGGDGSGENKIASFIWPEELGPLRVGWGVKYWLSARPGGDTQ